MVKFTTKDIAKLAGVSRATVSRVINNYPNVSADKIKRVNDIINEYGYLANSSARALAGKANNIIELVIIDINKDSKEEFAGIKSPYFNTFVIQLIQEAKKFDYLILINTVNNLSELKLLENNFNTNLISGAIIIGMEYGNKEIYELVAKEYNIVTIDLLTEEETKSTAIKTINSKDLEGAFQACNLLITNNHKEIAYIGGDNRLSSINRHQGYLKAMKNANIKINQNFIKTANYSKNLAYLKTIELFSQEKKPSAIFVANDIMTLGVIKALNELNLKIPDDVSIVTIDNGDFYFDNGLKITNFAINLNLLAQESIALLLTSQSKKQKELTLEFNPGNTIKKLVGE